MELEGYGLVMQAIQLAIEIRVAVNTHPLVSKYFRVLDVEHMVPAEFRQSGLKSYTEGGATWADAANAFREDEFILDPTTAVADVRDRGLRRHAVQEPARQRATRSSSIRPRATRCCCRPTSTTPRSDVANLLKVLVEISNEIEQRLKSGGDEARTAFAARVKSLVEDVPDLPNFSHFHDRFRDDPTGHDARRRHARRRSTWPTTTTAASTSS